MHRLCPLILIPLLAGCSWLLGGYSPPPPPPPPDVSEFKRVAGNPTLPTGKVTYDCGPEALTCVMRYLGQDVSVDEITARIYNPDLGPQGGTVSTQLAPMARQLGFAARYIDGTIGRLKRAVDRNEPPIIMVRINGNMHHFYVVTGYSDRKQMILCEEYKGNKVALTFEELNDLWSPTKYFMLEISRCTAETEFREGARLEGAGEHDKAIARYQAALAKDPAHQPSFVGLGNCYLAKNERALAIENYRTAVRYYEDDPKALNNLAHALWETGDKLDEARRRSNRSVQIYVDRIESLKKIHEMQKLKGASAESLKKLIQRINESEIELALAYGTLAAIRYALREYALAISAWKASYDLLNLAYPDLRARRLLMIARAYKHLNVRSQWKNYVDEALRIARNPQMRNEIETEKFSSPKSGP